MSPSVLIGRYFSIGGKLCFQIYAGKTITIFCCIWMINYTGKILTKTKFKKNIFLNLLKKLNKLKTRKRLGRTPPVIYIYINIIWIKTITQISH